MSIVCGILNSNDCVAEEKYELKQYKYERFSKSWRSF